MYYQTGAEVMSSGTNGVLLQTIHGSSLSGSVPGMMTLGTMTLKLADTGKSSSSVTETKDSGIEFKNTPDSLVLFSKEIDVKNVTGWSFRMRLSDASSMSDATLISGTYSKIGQIVRQSVPVKKPSNAITRLTATLNACHTENAGQLNKGLGGTIYTSALQFSDICLVYNSTISSAKINGKNAMVNKVTKSK